MVDNNKQYKSVRRFIVNRNGNRFLIRYLYWWSTFIHKHSFLWCEALKLLFPEPNNFFRYCNWCHRESCTVCQPE